MNRQNTDELIIIGGARGVGKTTVAKKVFELLHGSYVHPGDHFIRYMYSKPWIGDPKIIEGMALHEILNAPKPTIVDLHYKAYTKPTGYVEGFCDDSLKVLADNYSKIKLYLIELDVDTLYERRMSDPNKTNKKRKLEKETITEELKQNKEGFEHFVKQMQNLTIVEIKVIVNTDLEKTIDEILS
ncbi:hypothetical protein HY837_03715 [archaeon]|nr:hypothetical protein [archaeon]